jgi:chemotaxis methyl-accepting protein methylase/chemotaxis response regulator CheB/signal transduction histidine kinase
MNNPSVFHLTKPKRLIAVGASAGGLSAIQRFVRNLPSGDDWACVIVQHLSPDFKSLMEDLLSRHTQLPIHRVEDGMLLEGGSIYLIPPRVDMSVSENALHLHERPPVTLAQPRELPINLFFRSAAESWGPRAVGVVLSGTGSDGAQGARLIAAAGGLVLVQDPQDAEFPGMPDSVLATGLVNACDRAESLPGAIERLVLDPEGNQRRGVPLNAINELSTPMTKILAHLTQLNGIDFRLYKTNTIQRRIERRMTMRQMDRIDDYFSAMAGDEEERTALLHDLLIGVTCFFRDGEPFWELRDRIIPEIFAQNKDLTEFRAWVAGCATGEEAYSLSMLVHDVAKRCGFTGAIRIFASDAHRPALRIAAQGIYPSSALDGIPPEYAEQYVTKVSDRMFKINQMIRESVVFAPHNLLSDPPFTRLNLVTCRNLLIYLQPQAQETVINSLRFGLVRDGILMLGASEGLGRLESEFHEVNDSLRLYRKTREGRDATLNLPMAPRLSPGVMTDKIKKERPTLSTSVAQPATVRLLHDYEQVLQFSDLSALMIDDHRHVLHVFGDAHRLLVNRTGRFDADVLNRLPEAVTVAIGSLVQRAGLTRQVSHCDAIRLDVGDRHGETVTISVIPLFDRAKDECHYLIVFKFQPWKTTDAKAAGTDNFLDLEQTYRQRLNDLEMELSSTKQNLQATIEELHTTNEELQSTNEELQSANEELQSANEELHSVNEELFTVNSEHELNNRRLSELANDLESLFDATDMAIIFLDRDCQVRRFNRVAIQFFHILPQDLGRPLTHIASDFPTERLLDGVRDVLKSGQRREERIELSGNRVILVRLLAHVGEERQVEGALVTLTDISGIELAQRQAQHRMRLESVGRLAGGIAHDFNNILGGLLGYSDLLVESKNLQERELAWAKRVQLAGKHAAKLVSGLLQFARRGRDIMETCDLRAVMRDVVSLTEHALGNTITLDVHVAEQETFLVHGNSVQLQSSLVNLVINARDAMPAGGSIRLSLSIKNITDKEVLRYQPPPTAGQYCCISVSDHGQGIDPAVLTHLFEPFNTTKNGGTGLGLAVVYNTIKEHSGAIHVDTDHNGTCFTLLLPCLVTETGSRMISLNRAQEGTQAESQDNNLQSSNSQPTNLPATNSQEQNPLTKKHDKGLQKEPAAAPNKNGTIAIVDDEELIREFLCEALSEHGYQVISCATGDLALNEMKRRKIDLIISDMRMPHMDGPTLFTRIRGMGYQADFIFMSGYADQSLRDAIPLSAQPQPLALLNKPIDMSALLPLVEQAISRSRAKSEKK